MTFSNAIRRAVRGHRDAEAAARVTLSVSKAEAHDMLLRDRDTWEFSSDAMRRATAGALGRLRVAVQQGALDDDV